MELFGSRCVHSLQDDAVISMLRTLSIVGIGLTLLAGPVSAQPYGALQYNQDPNSPQSRDMYCRHSAAASTGYTTPREAANDEQTKGTVGGLFGGAALGAIIGGAAGNAGAGAAIGAGAGLVAGSAVGADNARNAARDVRADYSNAYYACMNDGNNAGYAPHGNGYGARLPRDDDSYGQPPPPPAPSQDRRYP
jgi:predicted lipid-binding transport protein (Tim44 family)